MRRRTFVELTAAGSLVTLGAGCVGDEGDGDTGDTGAATDDDAETTDGGGDDEEASDEPAGGDDDDGNGESAVEYVDEADGQVELAYGEAAELSNGVVVTAHGVTEVAEELGGAQPDEAEAFAVLELEGENGGDEEARLPDPTDPGLFLLYDDQQVEPVFRYEVFDATDYEDYEGGDLQGGVRREGHVLFGVDSDVDPDEIDFLWQDDFLVTGDLDGDVDVRWRTD